jgi:predicted  nucleic acid-binding Zn ribbon protein
MVTFEMLFRKDDLSIIIEKEFFLNDAYELIAAMSGNGQNISENDIFNFYEDYIRLDILCLEKDSINESNNGVYVNKWLVKIKEMHGLSVEYKMIDECYNSSEISHVNSSKHLILHWRGYSPVRSGDDFGMIPLYELPYTYINDSSYYDVNQWVANYEDIYALWSRGNVTEKVFYKHLSSVKSPLNKQGMGVRDRIELLTGKSCYYYLFNYNSRKNMNVCPCCGNNWKLEEKLFDKFDLKCDECRIISNTAM